MTVKTDRDGNGTYETTEAVEEFTVDGSGYAVDTLAYDPAGNLTYDGVFTLAYDAWNRMVKVTKAYRDGGGTLQAGSVIDAMQYDGRAGEISGSWDLCRGRAAMPAEK